MLIDPVSLAGTSPSFKDERLTRILDNAPPLDARAVVGVFDRLFAEGLNTRLLPGGHEPIYLPADQRVGYHRVVFSHDYVASALHEVAHWCVAGEARRQQEDYGYWYAPDGRSVEQQAEFERVEVKPQALEWILSVSAGLPFRVSADNLEAELGASEPFKDAVFAQVMHYFEHGFNDRIEALVSTLSELSCTLEPLSLERYQRDSL